MTAVLVASAVKSLVLIVLLLTVFAYMTWLERRLLARFQVRIGPNRVGPAGLLQPLADGLKLLFKESFIPARVDRVVYLVAPALSMVSALAVYAVIPLGPEVTVAGRRIAPYLADVNVGILVVLAISSLGVYGIILGGWSTDNKYALLGSLRSSAQLISYELALGLAVISVVLQAGSLSLVEIVRAQRDLWFVAVQPVAFLLYFVAAVAETHRAPFDLPEAEQELVAGYQTEYGGFRFALFYAGEYIGIVTQSALATLLFWGGWWGPLLPGVVWFLLKTGVFIFVFIWLRATLPRVRHDQLMALGWKVLVPVGLANIAVTGVWVALRG
ncbi:MAG: NADH-quinone oxidoreductase subunit NuoH [Armatimonadota bacterium]|nr:NADH-quinone oxidoreductase subunit NuoH [Armatimonadota bacterium]MDR7436106.1 NADH-quinone oxidoreductase subunit NuoH [Armatimonadota bacterium]MDR7471985.1 NADH-quinone oxidoreductase subunit NuoH [Armatimonadota bacterium]MDR7506731.1 NADH-quinone oxidoreductase subunit NuoH [Armatimonadota bacterium]MDR7508641.1 NADH-quinone oxidoreductase subunit NuoH [Armatimonadota bacterium]